MIPIAGFLRARRAAFADGRLAALAVLAYQGLALAVNGVSAPWLMQSFGVDQPALARAFAWIALSSIGAFLPARAADQLGRRTVLIWCVIAESIAAVGAALSTSLTSFILCDIVLLSAAGGAVACTVVWIAEATSDKSRAAGQGLAGLALVLGSGPAIVLMPFLARTSMSWRALFLLVASAVALAPFLRAAREPASGSGAAGPATTRPRLFDTIHRSRSTALVVTAVLSTIATSTVDSWRYVHIVNDAGLGPAMASSLVAFSGIAGLLGFPLGTLTSNRAGRIRTTAGFLALMSAAIACAFWGPATGVHPIAWLGASFATAALAGNAITVAANTAITELFPGELRATIFGALNLAGSAGRLAGQTVIAAIAPVLGSAAAGVGTLALVGLPAALLLLIFVPDPRRHPSPAAAQPRRRRRIPLILLANLVSLVLALSVAECGVRIWAPRAVMVPWQDDIRGVSAPRLDVRGRFAIPDRFDTTITIHNRFRSRGPVAEDPAAGITRIAVLGDSATFGWGAEDDGTYPAVVDRSLKESGHAVEVLNAGVIGTGTGEQALWYDVWVRRFNPSIVVLGVYWNDVDDDVRGGFFEHDGDGVRPRPYDVLERGFSRVRRTRSIANGIPGFAWLSQHSQLLSWFRQAPTDWLTAAHARAVGASAERAGAVGELRDTDIAVFRDEIRWLRAHLPASSSLVTVFVPSAEFFDPSRLGAREALAKSRRILATLHALSESEGLPFLDAANALGSRPDVSRLFFARDPHPNPSGYAAIGTAVATFLTVRGFVR